MQGPLSAFYASREPIPPVRILLQTRFETWVIYSNNVPTLGRNGWEKTRRILLGAFLAYIVFEIVQKHYTDLRNFIFFYIF